MGGRSTLVIWRQLAEGGSRMSLSSALNANMGCNAGVSITKERRKYRAVTEVESGGDRGKSVGVKEEEGIARNLECAGQRRWMMIRRGGRKKHLHRTETRNGRYRGPIYNPLKIRQERGS